MSDIKVTFPNNDIREYPKNTTFLEMSKDFPNAGNIIGVAVNNQIWGLKEKADKDCSVRFLTIDDPNGNRIYTAGLKMVFEYAVEKAFPGTKVKFPFGLPKGIVAELISDQYLKEADIAKINAAMAKIVCDDMPIDKFVVRSSDGINFNEEIGNYVKADNMRNKLDHTILMYRLDTILNYYYIEMPLSTGKVNKYELKYLGKNLVAISYPSERDHGHVPEFVNYRLILNSYIEGKNWLETMNVPYINDVNKAICAGNVADFVRSSELNFNLGINETAKHIANNTNIKCVMISGPSSSGKTTVTQRLANYCEIYGLDPLVISTDDYFKERVDSPKDENGEYDFECLQCVDLDYLANDVRKLFNGEEISCPKFNFVSGQKEMSGKKIKMKENSILLIEGLHAINDELLPIIPNMMKYKIFVSPFIPICLDEHNFISNYDLRLIRRIVRDSRTRGYNIASSLSYWKKVREGEEKYIFPYVHQANKIINTSLPYEIGALKVFVEPLLYSVPRDSVYYIDSRRLLNFLKQFFSISSEYIPKDSIIREFVGGGRND